MTRAVSCERSIQLTSFFFGSQTFWFAFYLLLLLLPVLLQREEIIVTEEDSVLTVAQRKKSLPHKACILSIKQHKCLEDLCAETTGQ